MWISIDYFLPLARTYHTCSGVSAGSRLIFFLSGKLTCTYIVRTTCSPPYLQGRNGHTATLADGRLFIIGGWLGSGPLAASDVHYLDLGTFHKKKWRTGNGESHNPRNFTALPQRLTTQPRTSGWSRPCSARPLAPATCTRATTCRSCAAFWSSGGATGGSTSMTCIPSTRTLSSALVGACDVMW